MAEEQIRLQMGFNLHQTTLKVEVALHILQEQQVRLQGWEDFDMDRLKKG